MTTNPEHPISRAQRAVWAGREESRPREPRAQQFLWAITDDRKAQRAKGAASGALAKLKAKVSRMTEVAKAEKVLHPPASSNLRNLKDKVPRRSAAALSPCSRRALPGWRRGARRGGGRA